MDKHKEIGNHKISILEMSYAVWVGGIEVTDYELSENEANKVAEYWRKKGYDDVVIVNYGKD